MDGDGGSARRGVARSCRLGFLRIRQSEDYLPRLPLDAWNPKQYGVDGPKTCKQGPEQRRLPERHRGNGSEMIKATFDASEIPPDDAERRATENVLDFPRRTKPGCESPVRVNKRIVREGLG